MICSDCFTRVCTCLHMFNAHSHYQQGNNPIVSVCLQCTCANFTQR